MKEFNMILCDERAGPPTGRTLAGAAFTGRGDGEKDADSAKPSAREQVETWLDAVALCFGLPEGRRWINP
jgi:hypothetical protein